MLHDSAQSQGSILAAFPIMLAPMTTILMIQLVSFERPASGSGAESRV